VNGDKIIRCATTMAVTAVAGIAAVVSYTHVYSPAEFRRAGVCGFGQRPGAKDQSGS
jgi:hypothetical protein